VKTATVLGGYGVFGERISRALAETEGISVRIAGRHPDRGRQLAEAIGAQLVACDVADRGSLDTCLDDTDLLVHAAGPFQDNGHPVARATIAAGVHYIDISDARDVVTSVVSLDEEALAAGVTVVSGASTVPAISGAMASHLARGLATIDSIGITLSPGNRNPRGSATIAAILSYLGRAHRVWIDGAWQVRHGWSDPERVDFPPPVGTRTTYACDVPDLELFPGAFGARTVRFRAGLELPTLNRALATLGWLRRRHLLPDLRGLAPWFRRASMLLGGSGTPHGGLHVCVTGRDAAGEPADRRAALIAEEDGPATPGTPAILLARKLLVGPGLPPGARPCLDMLTLREIVAQLQPTGARCLVREADGRWNDLTD